MIQTGTRTIGLYEDNDLPPEMAMSDSEAQQVLQNAHSVRKPVAAHAYLAPTVTTFKGYDLDNFMLSWSCNMTVTPFRQPDTGFLFDDRIRAMVKDRAQMTYLSQKQA